MLTNYLKKDAVFRLKAFPNYGVVRALGDVLRRHGALTHGDAPIPVEPIEAARALLAIQEAYAPIKELITSGLPVAFVGRSPWMLAGMARAEGLPGYISPFGYKVLDLLWSKGPEVNKLSVAARLAAEMKVFRDLVAGLGLEGSLTPQLEAIFGTDRTKWPIFTFDLSGRGKQFIPALGFAKDDIVFIGNILGKPVLFAKGKPRPVFPPFVIPMMLGRSENLFRIAGEDNLLFPLAFSDLAEEGIKLWERATPAYGRSPGKEWASMFQQLEHMPKPAPLENISFHHPISGGLRFTSISEGPIKSYEAKAFEEFRDAILPEFYETAQAYIDQPFILPSMPYTLGSPINRYFGFKLGKGELSRAIEEAIVGGEGPGKMSREMLSHGQELINMLRRSPQIFNILVKIWEKGL